MMLTTFALLPDREWQHRMENTRLSCSLHKIAQLRPTQIFVFASNTLLLRVGFLAKKFKTS